MYKTSFVFDLDNTLIDTTAMVSVFENGKIKDKINAQHYNKIHEIPTINEHQYDFGEFDSLEKLISENWTSPEMHNIFKTCAHNHPNSTFICTARSNPEMIYQWLKFNYLWIPLQNIVCKFPGEMTSQWKYKAIKYIARISEEIYVWEDDHVFIEKMKKAAEEQQTPIMFNLRNFKAEQSKAI